MPDSGASVMVISQSNKAYEFMAKVLPANQFSSVFSSHSAGEAERIMINKPIDLVVINTPLKDEFGTETAITLNEKYHCGVLIMVKAELIDEISFRVQDYGILTIQRPCTSYQVVQAMRLLMATQNRLHAMENKTATLEQKMADIKMVSIAKGLLMDHEKMTEPEAHHYLERCAMDKCIKKSQMAQIIIDSYKDTAKD